MGNWLKGWRPGLSMHKVKLPRGGDDGFSDLIRTGVVFFNNRRVFVERTFPRGSGNQALRIWGYGDRWGFDISRRMD